MVYKWGYYLLFVWDGPQSMVFPAFVLGSLKKVISHAFSIDSLGTHQVKGYLIG